jgi:phosphotriesterase-related protein
MKRLSPHLFILLLFFLSCREKSDDFIMTVNGPVKADISGLWLSHEHILVDFIGADSISPDRYEREDVITRTLPFIRDIKSRGCSFFVECTPQYLGRDPIILKALSDSTGVNFITNTGYYGARNNKFIPVSELDKTAEQLAEIWISEWENGIGGSGIKPGFIKIAVDRAPLSDFHSTLAKAAAIAHLRTGLTIASHTGPAIPAFQQMEIIEREGVSPEAFIWVHSHEEKDFSLLAEAAGKGSWVSFDKLNERNTGEILDLIRHMKNIGLLGKVLVSHDAGWYDPAKINGGEIRGFNTMFDKLIPALKEDGFTDDDIDTLFRINPSKAYTVKIRRK